MTMRTASPHTSPTNSRGVKRRLNATLAGLYERVARAVRAADAEHLIVYEPNLLFDFGSDTRVRAPIDERAVFGFHNYCLDAVVPGAPPAPATPTRCIPARARVRGRRAGDRVRFSWRAIGGDLGTWGFDVQIRRGRSWRPLRSRTMATALTIRARRGRTLRIRVRAVDSAGSPGPWARTTARDKARSRHRGG